MFQAFIGGIFLGVFLGLIIAALMVASSRGKSDDE